MGKRLNSGDIKMKDKEVKKRLNLVIDDCRNNLDNLEAGYVEASIVTWFKELDVQE